MKHLSLLVAAVAISLGGCASVAGGAAEPADHSHDHAAQAAPDMGAAPADPMMQGMQQMHRKMQAATPEERAAMMKEHMSAMPGGMLMMGQMKEAQPMQNGKEAMAPDANARSFDRQMQTMQEMHRKMQAAGTPKERAALREEHMKAMQGGMAMMGRMQEPMPTPTQDGKSATPGERMPAERDALMRRMDMMQMMMQMMMDREAIKPAHPKRK